MIGFFVLLSHPVIYKRNDYIYNTVFVILFIFSAYALISLMVFENLYGYLRNTVVVYSIFSFFLGTKLYSILAYVNNKDLLFLSALFPSASFYRTGYAASLPIYLSKYLKSFNGFSLLIIIVIILIVKLYFGGTTSIAVILLLFLLQLMTKKTKAMIYILSIGILIAFLIFMKPYLDLLVANNNINRYQILNMYPILNIDGNALTRFFFWAYIFFEIFLKNLFGIGLGTTLFPHDFILRNMRLVIRDPHLEYTLGAHNSFFTIMARFGIIGLLPFIFLYMQLINDFIKDKETRKYSRIFFFYYAFFIITGCAMLNVVLESPIHASLYWGTLGMLYQAKQVMVDG